MFALWVRVWKSDSLGPARVQLLNNNLNLIYFCKDFETFRIFLHKSKHEGDQKWWHIPGATRECLPDILFWDAKMLISWYVIWPIKMISWWLWSPVGIANIFDQQSSWTVRKLDSEVPDVLICVHIPNRENMIIVTMVMEVVMMMMILSERNTHQLSSSLP